MCKGVMPHLKVLAVNTFAVVATVNACLEALAVLLQAPRLLAVTAFVVPSGACSTSLLLHACSKYSDTVQTAM